MDALQSRIETWPLVYNEMTGRPGAVLVNPPPLQFEQLRPTTGSTRSLQSKAGSKCCLQSHTFTSIDLEFALCVFTVLFFFHPGIRLAGRVPRCDQGFFGVGCRITARSGRFLTPLSCKACVLWKFSGSALAERNTGSVCLQYVAFAMT